MTRSGLTGRCNRLPASPSAADRPFRCTDDVRGTRESDGGPTRRRSPPMGLYTKKCAYCGTKSPVRQMSRKGTLNPKYFHPECAARVEAEKRERKPRNRS